MKLLLTFVSIFPLLWCSTPPGQRADGQQGVECIEEIEIPRYGWIARLALKTGTVRAQIRIGKDGQLSDLTLEAPDPRLADEVRGWVKHTARFRPSCAGREVTLLFTYRLEGEATHCTFAVVRFRPPNHFTIISQPALPHILYMPVEPRKEDEKRKGP